MGTAKNYKFQECECTGASGNSVKIPAGIWPVAELDTVSVMVNGSVLTLNNSAFQQLKLEHKAVAV